MAVSTQLPSPLTHPLCPLVGQMVKSTSGTCVSTVVFTGTKTKEQFNVLLLANPGMWEGLSTQQ